MKKLENLLLKACGYTIITMALFYLVALIGEFTKAAIDFQTFALIFLFGIVIATAGLILEIRSMRLVFRIILHYFVLLIAFFFVFLFAGKLGTAGTSVIFSAIVVFTFLYALIFTITYLIKRAVNGADSLISAKTGNKKNEKKPYTPLYKTKD